MWYHLHFPSPAPSLNSNTNSFLFPDYNYEFPSRSQLLVGGRDPKRTQNHIAQILNTALLFLEVESVGEVESRPDALLILSERPRSLIPTTPPTLTGSRFIPSYFHYRDGQGFIKVLLLRR